MVFRTVFAFLILSQKTAGPVLSDRLSAFSASSHKLLARKLCPASPALPETAESASLIIESAHQYLKLKKQEMTLLFTLTLFLLRSEAVALRSGNETRTAQVRESGGWHFGAAALSRKPLRTAKPG